MAGVSGTLLIFLLHYIQHLAFGYSMDAITSDATFLNGVRASLPMRRVMVLSVCGLIAGGGWWAIYRYGQPLKSISQAVNANKPQMPLLTTVLHALLQVITIALGSPLGREVAPREIAAAFAIWLANCMHLTVHETKIMLACGAGAGLATVYNVPFAGALFTLEVLLQSFRWQAVLPALMTTSVATAIAWIGLGHETQYQLPSLPVSFPLLLFALVTAPIFGLGGFYFHRLTNIARLKSPHNWSILLFCFINFVLIGLLAIDNPALLGNGKSAVQIGFNEAISLGGAAILLCLRALSVLSSLRAGAQGGLLTPALANGTLLAIVLGAGWHYFFPDIPQAAYAVLGAAAFLAASQKMPLTAIVLIFEFTELKFNFLLPIIMAVGGAMASIKWLEHNGF